jgi:hypothetical protein
MKYKVRLKKDTVIAVVFTLVIIFARDSLAVSSKVVRHSSGPDMLKGQTEDVVISSRGMIQLGRAAEVLAQDFEDVWSVNCIVVSAGTTYIGTSPNGNIYKYSLGKLTKIYAGKNEVSPNNNSTEATNFRAQVGDETTGEPLAAVRRNGNDANEPDNEDASKAEQYLVNEHIFAMATDVAGRLLVGISGDECKLCRFEAGRMETIFEPNDAKYIFAIETDAKGTIYLGTGPQGKVYRLDPLGREAELVYESTRDKNILSLAIADDASVYAGTDNRGLVYKIDPRVKTAKVLYDSDNPEITALLHAGGLRSSDGDLYAAATSAEVVQIEAKFAAQIPLAGRPEVSSEKPNSTDEGGRKLQIANTKQQTDDDSSKRKAPVRKGTKPDKASHIYKIDKAGYVTDVFHETAVFFCLAEQQDKLLVGTGNDAQLFIVDPVLEQEAIIYKDEQASQITAATVAGEDVYLGTANPAKLVKLSKTFASEGTYISDLIDAGQPAKWGKLQIEAEVPQGCKVLVACRSGNVKDANDPSFSDWTEPVEVTEPVQLSCPLGRFCQYKLMLQSEDGQKSPLIREIAVASTVPNLAPKVESVDADLIHAPGKTGLFKISYKAKDDNDDSLIYTIDFRKIGRTNWVELADDLETDNFEWDGKTVEDGRYEVRITASDERSNTSTTKLTGSRISDSVVVDNTGPAISKYTLEKTGKSVTLKLHVSDQLSAIGKLDYTIDSNAEWKGALPEDFVYDTMQESFTVVIEDLESAEHIITVRVADDVGNTTYKTFDISIE